MTRSGRPQPPGGNRSVRGYVRQSTFTVPGTHAGLFDDLPSDVRDLAKVVQGLVVHYRNPELRSARLPKRRLREVNLRYVDLMISRLLEMDGRPLTTPRPIENRIIGCCRDFATLFTSMARHNGIPARIRVGFANYFAFAPARYWIDHTIAEFWDPQRESWRLIDPEQSDALVRENHLDFDPSDVPWGRFIVGGRAWEMCRREEADADDFCVEPEKAPQGLWFVRTRLLLDLAALNLEELLLWDSWSTSAPDAKLSTSANVELDRMAKASACVPPRLAPLTRFYTDDRWRHPAEVFCFSPVCPPYVDKLRSRRLANTTFGKESGSDAIR